LRENFVFTACFDELFPFFKNRQHVFVDFVNLFDLGIDYFSAEIKN